jgi:cytochrome c556
MAVPFDPELEDQRQLRLAAQEQWPQGPVEPSVVDVAPEVQQLPPAPMQIAPDPLVAQADAAMEQGLEPALPQEEEDLPPVVAPSAPQGAGSAEQGVTRQGGGRRSAAALLADVVEPVAGSGEQRAGGQAGARRSAAALLAEIPEESSALRRAGDVPIFIAQGITTGLKGLTDAFGADNAASQGLASNQEFYQAQLSPEAQASQQRVAQIQQAAQDQGLGAQVAAAGRAFAESPTAFVAQGVGTMAPTIVMGAAGKAVGLGARGVQAVQAATGATMGGGIVKGEIYQAVEQAMLQAGRSPQEAASAAAEAQAYRGENLDQILAGYGLGALATAIGAERLAGRAIAGAAAPTGGVLRVAGRTALQEALPEAAQGSQEQLARNLAQQREDFDVPTMRGVAGAGALEGLAGLAIGGPAGVASSVGSRAGGQPAPTGVQAPWQAAREQAVPTVTQVEVVGDDVFGEPTTAAVERPVATGEERFAPPPAAAEQPAPAAGSTASVPMMITRQMEADLLARGFSQQDINRMTPLQANEILAGAAPRPQPVNFAMADDSGSMPTPDMGADVFARIEAKRLMEEPIVVTEVQTTGAATPAAPVRPTLVTDLPEAQKLKDARGRSIVLTDSEVGNYSDENVMMRYAAFADMMQRAQEAGQPIAPEIRVNAATVYQEGRRRALVPPEPAIEKYMGAEQAAVPAAPAALPPASADPSNFAPNDVLEVTLKDGTTFQGSLRDAQGNLYIEEGGRPRIVFLDQEQAASVESMRVVTPAADVMAARDRKKFGEIAYTPPKTRAEYEATLYDLARQANTLPRPKDYEGELSNEVRRLQLEAQFDKVADEISLAKKKRRYIKAGPVISNYFKGKTPPRIPTFVDSPLDELEYDIPKPSDFEPDAAVRRKRSARPIETLDTFAEINGSLADANRRLAKGGMSMERKTKFQRIAAKRREQLEEGNYFEAALARMPVEEFIAYRAKQSGVATTQLSSTTRKTLAQEHVTLQQEHSVAEPAPARASKRIKKMTAQSGAVDLSIVEDLVEYGRTIYRAGMDYATWAAAMTREFGARVGQFLRQAFDRIVAAYQASRFSDTTGAVGDVRPKAKPRQLEAKARQNEALAPETRARLGSEYIPISLNAQATAAKEWINTNGLEAAKLRIAQLSGNDTTPTPLDFAIGIEASGRLSATGDHAGAAGIVSTMSQRATSLGQTISVLAMMARLTPEGIVLYGQNIVSRYINTLSPEAQERIKALQAEVDRLRTALADMKFKEGSEVIRSGKLGDEKIQDRIKRRVKARVQADLGPAAAGPEVTAETKARTQGLNRQVRDVLLSDAKQSEMIKQITQILTSQGNMPAAEAEAVGKSIVAAFTKIVTETRRKYVQGAKRGAGGRRGGFDALLKLLASKPDITDGEFVSEISQLMGLPGMTPALARELRALGQRYENATDPDVKLVIGAMMFEKAHELVPVDFWVKVRGFAYLSMLFAPKTWIRNVIGNQIQWIFNVGRDAVVSGIMDPAMSLLTGQRTTAGLKLGARLKGLLAPIEDVRRGYLANKQFVPEANFLKNFMAGVNHLRMLSKLTTQNKFEIADVRDVGARIFSSRLMRAWEGTLSIALGAGDRAFWMSQFRASLAQMQAAAEKNGEWTGQPTPEMIEAAMAEAAYAIYQNPNIVSANANKIRGALNRLSTFGKTDQYGLGTGLMAFTQVPGSITLRGLVEWSPLGMIPALYRGMRGILYASSTGRIGAKFDQAAFNKEFTQALLGTGALYAAGYYLYALGIVTASREDDDDLEAMRRASGGGAYRINLTALRRALLSGNWFTRQEGEQGDVIVPYDWAQPVAITFAAGAELAAQVERNSREQLKKGLADKAGMAAMSLAAGAKSLEELPLLSGLSSFIKTWGYAGPLEALTATVAGMPSQFVPQLVRQAGQINDNLVRETRGGDSVVQREFMKVLASVPGYSTKFPVRFDITGQAIQRYQYGGNSVLNVFFSPAMASEVKRNPVLQEVSRLVDTTGETSMVPRQVKRGTKINGVDVDLTNDQLAAYSYYLGNFTMSHFTWRMAAPVYARLPDEVKVKMLAQDITDIDAAVKSAVLGGDMRRLTRNQMFLRQALVNSPLGQSVPPK